MLRRHNSQYSLLLDYINLDLSIFIAIKLCNSNSILPYSINRFIGQEKRHLLLLCCYNMKHLLSLAAFFAYVSVVLGGLSPKQEPMLL